jgi:hypothetical protein
MCYYPCWVFIIVVGWFIPYITDIYVYCIVFQGNILRSGYRTGLTNYTACSPRYTLGACWPVISTGATGSPALGPHSGSRALSGDG